MQKWPKIKIFDQMVKANSILVGFSLFILLAFIVYADNWFGFKSFIIDTRVYNSFYGFLDSFSWQMLIIIIIPFVGAVFDLIYGEKYVKHRDKAIIYMGFIEIILIVLMYPIVINRIVEIEFAGLLILGVSFRIDMLAYTVLLVSAFVWFYVMIYAHEYMKKEEHGTRFFFFLALTYSAVLGTIVSGDLLTMFIFFEIMTITSYMLVIHGQKEESYKAGYNYIVMGLIGGFLIFTAIILIYFNIGDLKFASAIAELSEMGNLKYWIIGLVVFGFGIKAGMAPVHVWLPRAHPVAPTPASALLSGVLIKVGAYGIIRVAASYYFPSKDSITDIHDPIWSTAQSIGAIIIWTGIVTMILGVVMALQQKNIKKLLAYSSISQMGYILVGIGVALYLGYEGAMGYAGAIYHIINHALFKSLLFMVAGVIYYHTKELDMYKLGGLWKRLPFTTLIFVIGMFGIIGMPFFNGFISKSIIHHGLIEAHHLGSSQFLLAEILYIMVSIGTVCYFAKMFYYVFLRKTTNQYKSLVFDFSSLDLALGSMALLIIGIGIFPNFVMNNLVIPQLNSTTYDPAFIQNYILGLEYFKASEILLMVFILAMGIIMFLLFKRFKLFEVKLPKWLSVEYLFFLPAYVLMRNLCNILYGDKCPISDDDFSRLRDKDIEKTGFIDRFVITVNVLNRRYEQSVIRADALIYTFFVTLVLIIFVLSRI